MFLRFTLEFKSTYFSKHVSMAYLIRGEFPGTSTCSKSTIETLEQVV